MTTMGGIFMTIRTKAILTGVACLWAVAAPAATLPDTYSSLVVLGDSLSDTGNVFAQSGNTFPPPPYFNGQFSNDEVWAGQVAKDFTDAGLFSLNLAFGGAKAVTDADPSPDLAFQVNLFDGFTKSASAVLLGPRPLGVVFFGGNDLFSAAKQPDSLELAREAARAVRAQVEILGGLGLRDIVLVNSIDVSLTPRVTVEGDSDPVTAQDATRAFNELLGQPFFTLSSLMNDVTLFDFAKLSTKLLADPAADGFTNTTDACLSNPSTCLLVGKADEFLFWDSVHPNGVAHSLIAEGFRTSATQNSLLMAPIPLPAGVWSLLAGIAALSAVGAARARRAAA
jgi:outer membrane lipase/esterase